MITITLVILVLIVVIRSKIKNNFGYFILNSKKHMLFSHELKNIECFKKEIESGMIQHKNLTSKIN